MPRRRIKITVGYSHICGRREHSPSIAARPCSLGAHEGACDSTLAPWASCQTLFDHAGKQGSDCPRADQDRRAVSTHLVRNPHPDAINKQRITGCWPTIWITFSHKLPRFSCFSSQASFQGGSRQLLERGLILLPRSDTRLTMPIRQVAHGPLPRRIRHRRRRSRDDSPKRPREGAFFLRQPGDFRPQRVPIQ